MNNRAQLTQPPGKNKLLLVGIIVVALVLILVLFFVGRQFIGKAIAAPENVLKNVGEAGILGIDDLEQEIGIGANLGAAKSVAFEFELRYPSADNLPPVLATAFVPGKDWADAAFGRVTKIDSNTLKIEYATLDFEQALTGAVTLGKVKFVGTAAAAAFTVSNVKVLSLADSTNLITTIVAGPAVTTQTAGSLTEGQAGAVNELDLSKITDSTFTLVVGANTGSKESVAFEFRIDFPETLKVDSVTPLFTSAG
ncbi:MAG: hypothetical protein AABX13_02535, partial [Nanoarchaeota archaeon]